MPIRAVLTDIEGTTTSIAFVTDVLFPYARARLAEFVAAYPEAVEDVPGDDKIATLRRWMDADAKETKLKAIQGMIWAQGYADGTLRGHVYADAVAALRRWHEAGIKLYVFSSGSVAAQKLLFAHSEAGDLAALFSGYFDTTTGSKRDPASYAAIARSVRLASDKILFLSDAIDEVDAARAAGMQAFLIDRTGGTGDIASFDEINL